MRITLSSAAMLLVLATPLAGLAQTLKANEIATNLKGATTIAAPPASFDALSASDEELAYHGFPPRPDAVSSPTSYASWAKAITASKTRIVPTLAQTNIFHGPAKTKNLSIENTGSGSSYNWSGYVNLSGASGRTSGSFYYIISDYVVPIARQAFGKCTGGWDYSSSWVGIDGWGSSDVLQAGTESDAYCSGSTTSTYYSPWYEWYPYGEVRISNLAIAPGDDYFVEVWSTSATQGYAYLVNESTNTYTEIGFTAPSGTTLQGNSAEWIVERPSVGGSLATLTNYVNDVFWNADAYTFASTGYYSGSASSYAITGLDNSGNAESVPTYLGTNSFLMSTTGTAW